MSKKIFSVMKEQSKGSASGKILAGLSASMLMISSLTNNNCVKAENFLAWLWNAICAFFSF